jgi:hypothetical protein
VISASVGFILEIAHSRHLRPIVKKSEAALAAMGHPADFHTALFAQSLDAPHELVTAHIPVSDKNVLEASETSGDAALRHA